MTTRRPQKIVIWFGALAAAVVVLAAFLVISGTAPEEENGIEHLAQDDVGGDVIGPELPRHQDDQVQWVLVMSRQDSQALGAWNSVNSHTTDSMVAHGRRPTAT